MRDITTHFIWLTMKMTLSSESRSFRTIGQQSDDIVLDRVRSYLIIIYGSSDVTSRDALLVPRT